MNSVNNGGPAFPEQIAVTPTGDAYSGHEGMSLRDYFAAKALQGILGGSYPLGDLGYFMKNGASVLQNNAIAAYEIADAMIAAREAA